MLLVNMTDNLSKRRFYPTHFPSHFHRSIPPLQHIRFACELKSDEMNDSVLECVCECFVLIKRKVANLCVILPVFKEKGRGRLIRCNE